ncbi:MAG: helix-turn-helix transcriptional regulator [Candidatus Paceibacterota bacterium]|jgi:transcriptional regulator with XRE-family HTH domain
MIIQNTLAYYRKRKGYLQTDTIKVLGFCSTNRISRWEKGTAVPSIHNLAKLCALYDVSPKTLYPVLFDDSEKQINKKKSDLGIVYPFRLLLKVSIAEVLKIKEVYDHIFKSLTNINEFACFKESYFWELFMRLIDILILRQVVAINQIYSLSQAVEEWQVMWLILIV